MARHQISEVDAERIGVARLVARARASRVTVIRPGRCGVVIDIPERHAATIAMTEKAAFAVTAAAGQLSTTALAARTIDEACKNLGIDLELVRARSEELASRHR